MAAVGVAGLAACQAAPAASFNGIDITGATYASGFRLRDPEGRVRTLEDFRGKAVLVFFGFTQCPDVCPTALARAADTRRLLGPLGDRLQVVFITVDPERDTPPVLASYTRAFDPSFFSYVFDPGGRVRLVLRHDQGAEQYASDIRTILTS
ncbi:MAG: SCO family protein [Comamonadaceae bacterium]|nr:MAG: SCO family protein [Comamonadaceae bacterium]